MGITVSFGAVSHLGEYLEDEVLILGPILGYFPYFEKNRSRLMRSRCCPCVCMFVCVYVSVYPPPINF
jgi:hypothetical protein